MLLLVPSMGFVEKSRGSYGDLVLVVFGSGSSGLVLLLF